MKKVRKLLPVSRYDFPGMELWLGQMADQSLFPVKIQDYYAVFVRTGLPGTRFQVEPCWNEDYEGAGPEQARQDLYREYGWQLACSFGRSHNRLALFYTTDPTAPALYTDLTVQAGALERPLDHFRRMLRNTLYLAPLAVLLVPYSRRTHAIRHLLFDLDLVPSHSAIWILTVTAVVAIYLTISQLLRDYTALSQAHKQLTQGLAPTPQGPNRRHLLFSLVNVLVWYGYIIASFIYILFLLSSLLFPG